VAFNVFEIRKEFPNLHQEVHGKKLIYLDNAATTLKHQSVIDSVTNHYSHETSNIHRGVHHLSQEATLKYENTRSLVQHFINAAHAYEIVFTKGTTEGINLLAQTLSYEIKARDEVLITHMEHHSNIVPWQMLCERTGATLVVAPINKKGEIIQEEFEKLLNEKTKIVSFVHTSNSLGTINPVKEMTAKAHKVGAKVIIDAAQAVAHHPIDVQELDCDFLAFSGHKMFGPTGVGVLYGKEKLLNALPPYQGGGDMILNVTFEKTTYNQLPAKFEAGTPPIAQVIALGKAIEFIKEVGFNAIKSYEDELLHYAHNTLSEIEGLNLIGTAAHKTSVVSFTLDNVHPHDIGTFADQDGIALRTGHHCTQPIMDFFGVPATARASFSIYNTKEEIDILATSLKNTMEFFK
jgi:cysteine desulfurase/selenocysteine lyase